MLLSQRVNYPGSLWSRERREAFNHEDLLPVQCTLNGNPFVCIHSSILLFEMQTLLCDLAG